MFEITPITSSKELDCGATCLKMLLDYYGIDVPLDTLSKECRTRAIGCTLLDVKMAGKRHGLDMHAYMIDGEEVIRQDRPSIVWWGHNHFCVCGGRDENGKAVVYDPDRGRYRLTEGTFCSIYSGIALFNGEPVDLPEDPAQGGELTSEERQRLEELEALAATLMGAFE